MEQTCWTGFFKPQEITFAWGESNSGIASIFFLNNSARTLFCRPLIFLYWRELQAGFILIIFSHKSAMHRIRINTEGKAKVVAAALGTELINFLVTLTILHQDDLKKRMNRIAATWRNGCFDKMDDHPVRTTPNHHPPKMDVLPKMFL